MSTKQHFVDISIWTFTCAIHDHDKRYCCFSEEIWYYWLCVFFCWHKQIYHPNMFDWFRENMTGQIRFTKQMERFRASVKIQANIFFSMKLDRVTFFLQFFFRSFWMFLTNFLIRKAGVVPCSFEVSLLDKESPKLQFGLIVRSTGATLFDHGTKWSNSFILSQLFEYFFIILTAPNCTKLPFQM